jgi:hypothetical protein
MTGGNTSARFCREGSDMTYNCEVISEVRLDRFVGL